MDRDLIEDILLWYIEDYNMRHIRDMVLSKDTIRYDVKYTNINCRIAFIYNDAKNINDINRIHYYLAKRLDFFGYKLSTIQKHQNWYGSFDNYNKYDEYIIHLKK